MSNFNVFYRLRKTYEPGIIKIKDNSLIIENNRSRVNNKKHYKIFRNLNIFNENTTNQDVYENYFKPKILEFIENDVSVFSTMAYGQTGSGKTYTLFGNLKCPGLVFNIINTLLENKILLNISCLQIYNNQISDLLNNDSIIKIFDTPDRIKFSSNINTIKIDNYKNACAKINFVMQNRIIGCTKLNNQSSRSHIIFTIHFNNKKLYIIDLAGNEKGKYSVAHKDKNKLQEYIHINKSLFALKECIRSFSMDYKYIPYRNSKLTLLLKEIFFNNGIVSFIATLSPLKEHFFDIVDTLKFSTSLQSKRIVLSIHKKIPDINKEIKSNYLNYILKLYKLIHKDADIYNYVKKNNKNFNIDEIINLGNEKINYINDFNEIISKYKSI